MKQTIESLTNYAISKNSENFYKIHDSRNVVVAIISFVLIELLVLVFGKFLWNAVLPGLLPVGKMKDIWQMLGFSILIKLLVGR